MPLHLLIGLAAGLASAVLFASATAGGMAGRIILYFLAPLPSFLAGLGWGAPAALVAALAGSATLGLVMGGVVPAGVFLVSQGLPIVVLCHLALLNRPIDPPHAGLQGGPGAVEWYPPGRLVAAATIMAGALSVMSLLMLGGDLEDVRKLLRTLIERVFAKELAVLRNKPLSPEEITSLAGMALYVLPAASAASWLGGFVLNLWLAGRITLASGRLVRPWPDLAAMTFPPGMVLGLAIAMGLTFLPGYPGLIATGFAGALFFAFTLMGLAIIHHTSRGKPQRPFVLAGTYAALLVLNSWAALVIALIAVAEPMSPLRRDFTARPPPPPTPPAPD